MVGDFPPNNKKSYQALAGMNQFVIQTSQAWSELGTAQSKIVILIYALKVSIKLIFGHILCICRDKLMIFFVNALNISGTNQKCPGS